MSPRAVRGRSAALASFGLLVMLLALVALSALIYDVLHDGLGRLSWAFLTSYPSRPRRGAGIFTALVGSVYVIGLTALIAIPLGIGAAIHLEEYGGRGRLSRIIEINIANLAGVPSIIYGLLGLGLFVRTMRMGPSVLAGASHAGAAGAAGRHHLDARGAARRAEVAARGLLRARRHQMADDLVPGAAGGVSGHAHRPDPGAVARHRRNGAADHDRRADLCSVPARRTSGRRSPCCRSRSSTGCRGRRSPSPRTPPPASSSCSSCCSR